MEAEPLLPSPRRCGRRSTASSTGEAAPGRSTSTRPRTRRWPTSRSDDRIEARRTRAGARPAASTPSARRRGAAGEARALGGGEGGRSSTPSSGSRPCAATRRAPAARARELDQGLRIEIGMFDARTDQPGAEGKQHPAGADDRVPAARSGEGSSEVISDTCSHVSHERLLAACARNDRLGGRRGEDAAGSSRGSSFTRRSATTSAAVRTSTAEVIGFVEVGDGLPVLALTAVDAPMAAARVRSRRRRESMGVGRALIAPWLWRSSARSSSTSRSSTSGRPRSGCRPSASAGSSPTAA